MKLTTNERADLFGGARSLHPSLGAAFQNPMELTPEDIQQEIDATRRLKQQEMDRYQRYIDKLGMLLCFPNRS